jgi:sugar phosphate isomerase/epimerase
VLHANHAINLMDRADAAMHVAAAEASVEAARRLGASSMVIHSGLAPRDAWAADADRLLTEERDAFRRLGDAAAAAGVRLAVENLIAKTEADPVVAYGADPFALARQLTAIDHEAVGACMDFGHAWLSAPVTGFDYGNALEALSPHVWHLHLHDNCGRPGGQGDAGDAAALGLGDMHAPMFLGTIPWLEILPRMAFRDGTKGMIELNWRYMADARAVVDTARAFAAYLDGGPAPADPFGDPS